MNLKTFAGAFVVLLIATSGCLSPPPQNDPGDGNGNQSGYPPGVTADGVVDVDALFEAHRNELRDTAYEMNATESFRINGTRRVITTIQSFSAAPNGSTYVNKTQADEGTTVLVLNRWGPDDDGLYYLREYSPESVNVTYAASQDRSYLGLRNYTSDIEELVSQNVAANHSVERAPEGWSIQLGTDSGTGMRLLVNESGFIHRFRTVDDPPRPDSGFTINYRKIQSVERPSWVDRARESIGFRDASNETGTGNSST